MIDRFLASLTPREIGTGEPEFCNWPESVRQPAGPLYALGLPVHCLPVYGVWQYARLGPSSDLGSAVSYHQFIRLSRAVLSTTGVETAGFGSHSFRRGRAVDLFHGGADAQAVSDVLRHRSIASTRPYVTEETRMAGLAVTISAAAPRGRQAASRGRWASAAAVRAAGAPGAAGGPGWPPSRWGLPPRRPSSAPRARDHQQGPSAGAHGTHAGGALLG